ncbi:hypothetical protein CSAL01_09349 [Colletotrichum salicis]|uniref:Uncharacterized protein n=1 Tax=Colletotrichum salicis TaxID=1209931 RepID=A0A135V6J4_9PEZI|nr:hypothetical protein CSAL01_09349 [Colletotrichum salicis]
MPVLPRCPSGAPDIKGLLEYLEEDIIEQIHYDVHKQADHFDSQPILSEGKPAHHTITMLDSQAYTDEIYGDRHGSIDSMASAGADDQALQYNHDGSSPKY